MLNKCFPVHDFAHFGIQCNKLIHNQQSKIVLSHIVHILDFVTKANMDKLTHRMHWTDISNKCEQ